MADRRESVISRRQAVKNAAEERRKALMASLSYHDWQADADDVIVWIAEKTKTASDESYRDLSNIERKLQKQEAFARELRSNEARLKNINKVFYYRQLLWFLNEFIHQNWF